MKTVTFKRALSRLLLVGISAFVLTTDFNGTAFAQTHPGTDCQDNGACGSCPGSTPCAGPLCLGSPTRCDTPQRNETVVPGTGNKGTQTNSPCYNEADGACTISSDTDPRNEPIICDGYGGLCCVTVWSSPDPKGNFTECCDKS
jgi:hypothetical protein